MKLMRRCLNILGASPCLAPATGKINATQKCDESVTVHITYKSDANTTKTTLQWVDIAISNAT